MQDTILGLDIGTSSTKAVLFDLFGQEVAAVQQSYPLSTPHAGWAEQDPEQLWNTLLDVLREVISKAGDERRILAMSLATQSGSLIAAKADGTPLYPMITWLDSRAEEIVQQWRAEGLEEQVRRSSGWRLQSGLSLPGIAWLKKFRPDVFNAAERFLGAHDFLLGRLTGEFTVDLSGGTEMQLLDISSGQWSKTLCALVGITPAQLSHLIPAGQVIAPITAEVSRLTGLSPETLVVSGGHDQTCAALAMGLINPGQLMLATGTAWVITGVAASPAIEAIPAQMDLNFHIAPNRWTVSQLLGGFGASVEWWLQQNLQALAPQTALSRAELYAQLERLLAQSQPGSNKLLFLAPEGGAQLSDGRQAGGFIGLQLAHTRADMSRAILEGIAFEVRWALEMMRRAELSVERLWVAGGATQSQTWTQILADVCNVPLLLTQYAHWPALGAAILAGFGVGVFDTLEAGIARFQRSPRQITPDESHKRLYDEQFQIYKRLAKVI